MVSKVVKRVIRGICAAQMALKTLNKFQVDAVGKCIELLNHTAPAVNALDEV